MKKTLAMILAASMCCSLAVTAFAAGVTDITATGGTKVYDADGNLLATLDSGFSTDVEFDQTLYIDVADLVVDQGLSLADINDDDKVSFSSKKTTGSKYISKLSLESEYRLDGHSGRGTYIKLTSADILTTDEQKVQFTATFKAKKDDAILTGSKSGDKFEADFTIWLSNPEVSDDITAGDGGVYKPEKNDDNELVWSDGSGDVAMLKFYADDSASKMAIKLSTKSISSIYTEYGDPVDAELYFRAFQGVTNIPSTSRANLYLYSPFEDDDVDYRDVFIYTLVDGELSDATMLFKWDSEEEAWTCKTRQLGTYIISDTELILEEELPATPVTPSTPTVTVPGETPDKVVPNTGRW